MGSKNHTIKSSSSKPEEIVVPELEALIGTSRNKPWSDYEVEVLKKYYVVGVPVKNIAQCLGRTLTAVQKKATALGLKIGK